MHTHMHHSLLPPSMADCKIIYICREPKDMLVSMWHFIMAAGGGAFPFSDLFEFACEGKNPHGPIWDHILGYSRASKVSPERVLFLRYEEMLLDPVSVVPRCALHGGRGGDGFAHGHLQAVQHRHDESPGDEQHWSVWAIRGGPA